jgi:hypothetical protein
VILGLEETFKVGHNTFFNSISPTSLFGVTFEDDLETGYFYAVDTESALQVLDALHIYNVVDIIDNDKSSKIQIAWSDNGQIASLLINNYCYAILILTPKQVIAETGFPESKGEWAKVQERTLTDELLNEIFRYNK